MINGDKARKKGRGEESETENEKEKKKKTGLKVEYAALATVCSTFSLSYYTEIEILYAAFYNTRTVRTYSVRHRRVVGARPQTFSTRAYFYTRVFYTDVIDIIYYREAV